MVYKRLSGDCPSYLSQMLIRNADINERSSRHGLLNLVCPRFKRESEGGRSFTVSTTRLWNMIPSNIRNKPSLVSFKKAMFDYFKDTHKHLDHFTFQLNSFYINFVIFRVIFTQFLYYSVFLIKFCNFRFLDSYLYCCS